MYTVDSMVFCFPLQVQGFAKAQRKYQGGDAKIGNTHQRIGDGLVMGNTVSAKS